MVSPPPADEWVELVILRSHAVDTQLSALCNVLIVRSDPLAREVDILGDERFASFLMLLLTRKGQSCWKREPRFGEVRTLRPAPSLLQSNAKAVSARSEIVMVQEKTHC